MGAEQTSLRRPASPYGLFESIEEIRHIPNMELSDTPLQESVKKNGSRPPSRRIKLSEECIRSLPFGAGTFRDTVVRGLLLLCHKTCKTFVIQTDLWRHKRKLKSIRITIGRVDRVSLRVARSRARELLAAISRGEDPTASSKCVPLTLHDIWVLYENSRNLSPKTRKEYAGHLNRYLKKWLPLPLHEIGENRQMVRELHERITTQHGSCTGNHVLKLLRALYNFGLRQDPTLPQNPVVAVAFNPELRRDWSLSRADLPAWYERVNQLSPVVRDVHVFLLFSGLRRTDACTARWEHLDEAQHTLYIPCPKGGVERGFTLPLSHFLMQLLNKRQSENEMFFSASPWIFPAQSKSGHVEEPKRKGMPSPHAYRHTYRTLSLEAGIGYTEVSLLLNHKIQSVSFNYISRHAIVAHLQKQQEKMTAYLLSAINGSVSEASEVLDSLEFLA